jgi:pimeloyl-ACP methyl ester carboxylesterase
LIVVESKRAPSVPSDIAEDWVVEGQGGVGIRCYGWRSNTGGRPSLVWGHANGFSAGAYTPILNELAEDLDVYAYDMRCHGGSEDPVSDPDGDYDAIMTTDCLALDFLAVIDAIRRRSFRWPLHFAGHSASCLATLRLAGALGHAPFQTMTMFEPPMAPTPDHALHAAAGVLGEVLSRRATKRKRHLPAPEAFAASLADRDAFARWRPDMLEAFTEATLRPDNDPANTQGWTLRCEPAAEAAVYRTTMDCSTFKALSACTRPILFVESDPTIQGVAPSWATRVQALSAAQAPKGSLARIDQTSHMMPFERPEAVLEMITNAVACS